MVRTFFRSTLLAAAALVSAAWLTAPQAALADGGATYGGACPGASGYGGRGFLAPGAQNGYCRYRAYGRPDLFYNFYVPGRCGGYPAEMYPAPKPTPPIVGHVYYTYQPFMPHEMMYRHSRHYYNFYDGGRGLNHTTVHWW
jgi:hypothetical protein